LPSKLKSPTLYPSERTHGKEFPEGADTKPPRRNVVPSWRPFFCFIAHNQATKKTEVIIMPRYLLMWEIDQTKIPINPKERGAGWAALMNMVRQDRERGINKDWGEILGTARGYAVYEGSELDVAKALQQYVPFARFQVHPIASESQVNEVIKGLTG